MLTGFFLHLKAHKLPVSTRELLTLLEALEARVISLSIDDFYTLSRACFVKDEQHFDRFDLAFGTLLQGRRRDLRHPRRDSRGVAAQGVRAPLERRGQEARRGHGRLRQADGDAQEAPRGAEGTSRGRQQVDRHGRHEPVRRLRLQPRGRAHRPGRRRLAQRGQGLGRAHVSATSTATSSSTPATSRSRCAACASSHARACRTSSTSPGTIEGTARNAGWLDVHMQPERRNRVKVLLFLDVGGSMDPHVRVCEELFSAAKAEFRQLEHFYFHNCVYDHVWRDNGRRRNERFAHTRARAHVWPRLEGGLRGRCRDEPVRAHASRRQRRIRERRARHRVAFAHLRALPPRRVVESRAIAHVGVHAFHADHPAQARPAHVSAHARPASRRASTPCVIDSRETATSSSRCRSRTRRCSRRKRKDCVHWPRATSSPCRRSSKLVQPRRDGLPRDFVARLRRTCRAARRWDARSRDSTAFRRARVTGGPATTSSAARRRRTTGATTGRRSSATGGCGRNSARAARYRPARHATRCSMRCPDLLAQPHAGRRRCCTATCGPATPPCSTSGEPAIFDPACTSATARRTSP